MKPGNPPVILMVDLLAQRARCAWEFMVEHAHAKGISWRAGSAAWRRLRSCLRFSALAVLFYATPHYAGAQSNQVTPNNQTGLAPYNTYAGDHENVNLATSDLNLELPLVSLPGRDHHNVTLSLMYDSRQYELAAAVDPNFGFNGYYWTAVANGGWRLNIPSLAMSQRCDQLGDGTFDVYKSDFIVTLAEGAKHHFPNKVAHSLISGTQASCQGGPNISHPPGDTGGYSGDGSVLYFDTSDANNPIELEHRRFDPRDRR